MKQNEKNEALNIPQGFETLPKPFQDFIYQLIEEIKALKAENAELRLRLGKDSSNSNKPPSTDQYVRKSKPRSERVKSGKKTGGQPGHRGKTLESTETPDEIKYYDILECSSCKTDLSEVQPSQVIRRQELDIPPSKPMITEHQMASKFCTNCQSTTTARGPENLTQPIQFGVNIIALVNYLNQGQFVPLNRVQEMLSEMFSLSISEGTLVNMIDKAYTLLEDTELDMRKDLDASSVLHTDETSVYVNGETWWMHVISTVKTTLYFIHRKRGKDAMDAFGVLGKYLGTIIHDHFSPYFLYLQLQHALCNAHHIRELRAVAEDYNQPWCMKMRQLLLDANTVVENHKSDGKTELSAELLKEYSEKYDAILAEALSQIPEDPLPEIPKKRGRKKQHKAKNLFDRLSKEKKEVLLFMYDFRIPFTNNQAERDLRMVKLKQKVSGCFRSPEGAQRFSRIRSYISTCRKRNINIMQALVDLARGQPISI